jgi:hypothetical protein
MKTVEQLLRTAHKILSRNQWNRGHLFTPNGRVCAIGALMKADGMTYKAYLEEPEIYDRLSEEAREAQRLLKQQVHPSGLIAVEHFNDHVAKNKQEVLDIYCRAIKAAKK